MIKFRNFALFLCGVNFLLELSTVNCQCLVTDDLSSRKTSLYLHIAGPGDRNNKGRVHILSTSSIAISNAFSLVSKLDGSGLLGSDLSCPPECLIELSPMEYYAGQFHDVISMVRPVDYNYYHLLNFYNRTPLPENNGAKIFCAPTKGWCGANVNLYRYVSFAYEDYYVTTAIEQNATYGLDNLGIPICYIWGTTSTSSSNKLKWALILLGVAVAALLIIALIALVTVCFVKAGATGSKVDGLYQGDQADTPPRLVESQPTQEPVHADQSQANPQQPQQQPHQQPQKPQQPQKHFDISDPRGDVPDAYAD